MPTTIRPSWDRQGGDASDRAEIEQLIEMESGALKALAAAERGDLEGPDV